MPELGRSSPLNCLASAILPASQAWMVQVTRDHHDRDVTLCPPNRSRTAPGSTSAGSRLDRSDRGDRAWNRAGRACAVCAPLIVEPRTPRPASSNRAHRAPYEGVRGRQGQPRAAGAPVVTPGGEASMFQLPADSEQHIADPPSAAHDELMVWRDYQQMWAEPKRQPSCRRPWRPHSRAEPTRRPTATQAALQWFDRPAGNMTTTRRWSGPPRWPSSTRPRHRQDAGGSGEGRPVRPRRPTRPRRPRPDRRLRPGSRPACRTERQRLLRLHNSHNGGGLAIGRWPRPSCVGGR